MFSPKDTITALATPYGAGAIALVRISGMQAFEIAGKILASRSGRTVNARNKPANSSFFALLKDGEHLLDEVMVTVFKGPRSFTGEDSVEISCHGSVFIQNQVLQFLIRSGARLAEPGEFTLRAFMNGKMDLSQAEAVADLIASNSEASHKVAINQMRGGFSREIRNLREELIHFASLIELELDFSEEDVEFADRRQLESLVLKIQSVTRKLADSFALGNVIKNGLPVAIVGKPNAGKSTLLNVLLNEERAIVSDIPGTTRDTIEDEIHLGGISFRFIDTAGIRETSDTIESIGVKKTYEKIRQARIVIYLFDVNETGPGELSSIVNVLSEELGSGASLLLAGNKTENKNLRELEAAYSGFDNLVFVSAREKLHIHELTSKLQELAGASALEGNETVVTNIRHLEALNKVNETLNDVYTGLKTGITGDFLAMDIRRALHYLGEITGEITTEDLLGNIFSKFCIGK